MDSLDWGRVHSWLKILFQFLCNSFYHWVLVPGDSVQHVLGDQVITVHVEGREAVIPAGGSPVHLALEPQLVREISQKHSPNTNACNSPTNFYGIVFRVLGNLQNIKSHIHESYVCYESDKINCSCVGIDSLNNFASQVVFENKLGMIHPPLLPLREQVKEIIGEVECDLL